MERFISAPRRPHSANGWVPCTMCRTLIDAYPVSQVGGRRGARRPWRRTLDLAAVRDHEDTFAYDKAPDGTWHIDVLSYDARRQALQYYRGGEDHGLPRTLLTKKQLVIAPDGRNLVMGCDYIEVGYYSL